MESEERVEGKIAVEQTALEEHTNKDVGEHLAEQNTAPVPVAATRGPHTPLPPISEDALSFLGEKMAIAPSGTRLDDVPATPQERDITAYSTLSIPATEAINEDHPPDKLETSSNRIDQTLHKLNDAARQIAEEEPHMHMGRTPRASRLTPFYDVSEDIHRDSTPLPRTSYSTQPQTWTRSNTQETKNKDVSDDLLPDLWPWHSETEEENEQDLWSDQTDPLLARQLPSKAEIHNVEVETVRSIEQDDRVNNASLERLAMRKTMRLPVPKRWRALFVSLTILAVLALVVDGILVWMAMNNPNQNRPATTTGQPNLTLDHNTVQYGQKLTIHIRNFTPNGMVSLTRDIGEPILKDVQQSLLQVNAQGTKDIEVIIDNDWDPGMHSIQAEDTKLRFTANATVRVNAGPTRPPRLVVSTTTLDLGPGIQGSTTVQPLKLQNGGGGVISWSATSDQPWLALSPTRGIFSDSMEISVGGSRMDLVPQEYTGTITITASGQPAVSISVTMTVRPLPENAGPVLAITPAVLAFTAVDGGQNPEDQHLVIRNPGTEPLHWTLQENKAVANTASAIYYANIAQKTDWLKVSPMSGVVEPQSQITVRISINSRELLPGVYTKTLLFGAQEKHRAMNSPSPVTVSLTVQPGCGVALTASTLHFTGVTGRGNPSTQSFNVNATDSCQGQVSWRASASESWLSVTPERGQLTNPTSSDVLTASVNTSGLKPGTYTGVILISMAQSMRTVSVELIVQETPKPSAPVLGALSQSVEFKTVLGQSTPAGRQVTLTNTGGGSLRWYTEVNMHASAWLGVAPTGGTIDANETGTVTINVNANNLTPGTYIGQVIVNAVNQANAPVSGSPQVISVSFEVLPVCSVEGPSRSTVQFTESDDGSATAPVALSFSASGGCSWPLTWDVIVPAGTSWLSVTPTAGSLANENQEVSLSFGFDQSKVTAASPRRAVVDIVVRDVNGNPIQSSPQKVTVSLVKPCSIQATPGSLAFESKQGQGTAAQSIGIGLSGFCQKPVSWTAVANDGSSGWLQVLTGTGVNDGDENLLEISVKANQLSPGIYNGSVIVTAVDNAGGTVRSVVINVTLTVSGHEVSGTVYACPDTTCATPPALPGATVILKDGTGKTIKTGNADANGNYSLTGIANGTYTLLVEGTTGGNQYTGSKSITVSGDTTVSINANGPTTTSTSTSIP